MKKALLTEDQLLTVAQVAGLLQVNESWVYGHADDLGAIRLGKYLRFSKEITLAKLKCNVGTQPNAPPLGRTK